MRVVMPRFPGFSGEIIRLAVFREIDIPQDIPRREDQISSERFDWASVSSCFTTWRDAELYVSRQLNFNFEFC